MTHYSHYGVTICYHVSVNKKPYGGEDSTGLKKRNPSKSSTPKFSRGRGGKMTEQMGYRNVDRVYALASQGKFSKTDENGKQTLDLLALSMMTYMASKVIDKEDVNAVVYQDRAYWCYWEGWDKMIEGMGMVIDSKEHDLDTAAETTMARTRTARNRLSRGAKFLQEQGCIKQLKAPIPLAGKNAIWLLLLGNERENREAERIARLYFNLPPMKA